MARTIWKFEMLSKRTSVEMPQNAKVLHVGSQGESEIREAAIFLWAEVDLAAPVEKRTFVAYGTGWPLPEDTSNMRFLGTTLLGQTSLVYHVYEEWPN